MPSARPQPHDYHVRAWLTQLLNAPAACEALDARRAEFDRWVAAGKIPVASSSKFHKWGQNLTAKLYDPAALARIRGQIPQWRAEHAARPRTKPTNTAHPGAPPPPQVSLQRRLPKLAASAGLTLGPDRYDGRGAMQIRLRPTIDIVVDPSLPLVSCSTNFLLSFPVPPEVSARLADGAPPRNPLRTQLVERLKESARFETAQLLCDLEAVLPDWRLRLQEKAIASGVPLGPDVLASLQLRLSTFHAQGAAPLLTAAFKKSLDTVAARAIADALDLQRTREIREHTGFSDFPALFPAARALKRRLLLFVGPTNSGKTHAALELLTAAASGVYTAPLRLMAQETHERLAGAGVPCSMVTGEERILVDDARHVSCTIETIDTDTPIEVAVIDEIQMLADPARGWAWTAALIGLPAATVAMTGAAEATPFLQTALALTGEQMEIRTFERLAPLRIEKSSVGLSEVRKGDAVVAFSRAEVLRLKEALVAAGRTVAVVYGALGPEVRRSEAQRFRDGDADVLVATDAIGMGLNFGPLKRVLFSALEKFDGVSVRPLAHAEIRQIAGRAGRYGAQEEGLVGVLGSIGLKPIERALAASPGLAGDARLFVSPTAKAIDAAAELLGTRSLRKILRHFAGTILAGDPRLRGKHPVRAAFSSSGWMRCCGAISAL